MQVGHFHHEVVDALAVLGDGDFGLGDIPMPRRDGRRDLGQEPRTVAPDVDRDLHRTGRGLRHVPLHPDDPLLVQEPMRDGVAIPRVDGQPAPPGDEAHDGIAVDGRAAPGEAHQEVLHAADLDAAVALGGTGRLLGLGLGAALRLEHFPGGQLRQHLVDPRLPVTDGGQEVVDRGEAEIREDLLHHLLRPQEGGRGEAVLPRRPLEELAPEAQRARALLGLEPLVNLGAGARGFDDLEPVAARMLGG